MYPLYCHRQILPLSSHITGRQSPTHKKLLFLPPTTSGCYFSGLEEIMEPPVDIATPTYHQHKLNHSVSALSCQKDQVGISSSAAMKCSWKISDKICWNESWLFWDKSRHDYVISTNPNYFPSIDGILKVIFSRQWKRYLSSVSVTLTLEIAQFMLLGLLPEHVL